MRNVVSPFALILLVLILFQNCTYENPENNCVDDALERYQMRPYYGESISGCQTFLMQFRWRNEIYFDWNNHCVDRLHFMPTNCNGNNLASSISDPALKAFEEEAETIRIVGIQ